MKIGVINTRSSGIDLEQCILEQGHELLSVLITENPPLHPSDQEKIWAKNIEDFIEQIELDALDAVLPGSDEAVTLADMVAYELGLSHNDPHLCLERRDKFKMIQSLHNRDIPAPQTFEIFDEEHSCLSEISFPLIVKPPSSSGSDSVTIVNNLAELHSAVDFVQSNTNRFGKENISAVVQEFLHGQMYVVNTVSLNGAHCVSEVYEKEIILQSAMPISGSMILVPTLSEREKEIIAYTFDCLDALGISFGPAHSEIIMTATGPRLVEVNSRLMGPAMPADIFVPTLGYSQATLTVESIGNPSKFLKRLNTLYAPLNCIGQTQLRPHCDGILVGTPGFDTIRQLPGFAGIFKVPQLGVKISDRYLTTASTGIAYFRHPNISTVKNSIHATQDLCTKGEVFDVIGTHV